jgi:hypothetical protein
VLAVALALAAGVLVVNGYFFVTGVDLRRHTAEPGSLRRHHVVDGAGAPRSPGWRWRSSR